MVKHLEALMKNRAELTIEQGNMATQQLGPDFVGCLREGLGFRV